MDILFKRVVVPAAVLGLIVAALNASVLTWKIIPPGYTGIRVNRLVGRGISHEDTVTGFVLYNPDSNADHRLSTFIQRVVWTHDLHEGNPLTRN